MYRSIELQGKNDDMVMDFATDCLTGSVIYHYAFFHHEIWEKMSAIKLAQIAEISRKGF